MNHRQRIKEKKNHKKTTILNSNKAMLKKASPINNTKVYNPNHSMTSLIVPNNRSNAIELIRNE